MKILIIIIVLTIFSLSCLAERNSVSVYKACTSNIITNEEERAECRQWVLDLKRANCFNHVT